MKQLLLVSAVAVVFSFANAEENARGFNYYYQPKSPTDHSQYADDSNHNDVFMGPSFYKLFERANLNRGELMAIIGSGFGPLMKKAMTPNYASGMGTYKDVSMAMIQAARQVLEARQKKGEYVNPKQFENLQNVEQRLPTALDAFTAIFDGIANPKYSLENVFTSYDFTAAERSTFYKRILISISKAAFGASESVSRDDIRKASNVFLPALRKFLEDRLTNDLPVTQDQIDRLERAEELVPSILQALDGILQDPLVIEFMQTMNIDATERMRQVVLSFYASMDALFMDPSTTVGEILLDIMLSYIPSARQVIENRLALGIPVTQEEIDRMEHVEQVLAIMLTSHIEIANDMGIF